MEQEAENTVLAAEQTRAEKRGITISEEQLSVLLQAAATAAVKEFRKEETKAKKKQKYHDTYRLMHCYRDAVFHIENAISEGAELDLGNMSSRKRIYVVCEERGSEQCL